ncbi:uncharacterized protein [Penaeus vannamei]|uniref:uncharacterized protein n=1 Tax=Penaeus vannamei TaxID=6689 RepID=UPI000F682EF3|nr:uncharacterized protein LOC113830054 [Penaeus vannamei]XP_027239152.1 uncharacterized protein LOC113830054 [Penaeus vannamei]
MKTFVAVALLCLFAVARAEDDNSLEETARFGFLSLDDNGATLSFNSTSLQTAVVVGVILLILALVLVPLLGFDLAKLFAGKESYDYPNYAYDNTQGYSSYTSYAQRSLNLLSPVLTALTEAYKKYE